MLCSQGVYSSGHVVALMCSMITQVAWEHAACTSGQKVLVSLCRMHPAQSSRPALVSWYLCADPGVE
jgi:hypothetical protein